MLRRSRNDRRDKKSFSETPAVIGRAPKLGQHNEEVLQGLGYSADEIAAFSTDGVI